MFGLGQGAPGRSVRSQKGLRGQGCGPPRGQAHPGMERQLVPPVGPE